MLVQSVKGAMKGKIMLGELLVHGWAAVMVVELKLLLMKKRLA